MPASFKFRDIIEAWLFLWACRVGLWLAPFPRVLRASQWCAQRLLSRRPMDAARVVAAVHRALPLTLRASCLTQALAGWIMLTRHGAVSRIRIGVTSPQQGFKAHAWLEADGQVILGDVEDTTGSAAGLEPYHVIWTLPPERGAGL